MRRAACISLALGLAVAGAACQSSTTTTYFRRPPGPIGRTLLLVIPDSLCGKAARGTLEEEFAGRLPGIEAASTLQVLPPGGKPDLPRLLRAAREAGFDALLVLSSPSSFQTDPAATGNCANAGPCSVRVEHGSPTFVRATYQAVLIGAADGAVVWEGTVKHRRNEPELTSGDARSLVEAVVGRMRAEGLFPG